MRAAILTLMVLLAGCDKPIITIDLKGQPAQPRFQLVMHPEFPGKFTFLLDTQTGALWQQKEIIDLEGKPTMWTQELFQEPIVPRSALSPVSDEVLAILHPPIKKEEAKP